ncbi:hypothetical protein FSP39_021726 [Pinctada imbricata]|uniref:THAP-type domain-containing protein n=1 Tax=Pinctada imbricata TaxID=66713 RepID=A0AA88YCN9_PINIB|nr:hypothetical protein FSP39_021726 [Pinctada imbricata]
MADSIEEKSRTLAKGKGRFCCAGGCTNTNADGVSLHSFPSEKRPDIRRKWIKFIRDEQINFVSPTKYQFICERHFTKECYPKKYSILEALGKHDEIKRKDLNPDAVPTIHLKPKRTQNDQLEQNEIVKKRRMTVSKKLEISRIMNPRFHHQAALAEDFELDRNESDTGKHDNQDQEENNLKSTETIQQTRSVGIQISKRLPHRSKYIQTSLRPQSNSIGVQCNMAIISKEDQNRGKIKYPRTYHPSSDGTTACEMEPAYHDDDNDTGDDNEDDDNDGGDGDGDQYEAMDDNDSDEDFIPPTSPSEDCHQEDESFEEIIDNTSQDEWCKSSYIVYGSQLLELFSSCPKCQCLCSVACTHKGSMISLVQECICGYTRRWNSQPFVGPYPAGNLDISAGILFSGSIPSKTLRFMQHMSIRTISSRTFFNHQQALLFPSILSVWTSFQQRYLHTAREKNLPLSLGGDGRCDTPGHSAKFCSYTMLDVNLMVVADIQLVQSNEVKSSSHMEKEGLIRAVKEFQENGLAIGELVTDRHPQITKFVREEMPNTKHYFDVWHVAKGLKKKLQKVSQLKDCSVLQPWIQSITNHLYWSPVSSPDGGEDLILEKWLSVLNHITNIHVHSGDKFPKCLHGPIPIDQQRQWLDPSSKAFVELEKIAANTRIKKDIRKLSPGPQTAALEGYHSILNHFAPKMIGFSYEGMLSRLLLAALHFNENMQRPQACTREGAKRFSIVFPKAKGGHYSLKEVKEPCTFAYVETLKDEMTRLAINGEGKRKDIQMPMAPPPLSASYFHPVKEDAINNFQSRFKLLP